LLESLIYFGLAAFVSAKGRFGGFAALCVHCILPIWRRKRNAPFVISGSTKLPSPYAANLSLIRGRNWLWPVFLVLLVDSGPAARSYAIHSRQGLEQCVKTTIKHFTVPARIYRRAG
jgi:hypothetical protein